MKKYIKINMETKFNNLYEYFKNMKFVLFFRKLMVYLIKSKCYYYLFK